MSGPIYRQFISRDARNENVAIPRYVPPEKSIRLKGANNFPIVRSDVTLTPGRKYTAIDTDYDDDAVFERNDSTPQSDYRFPKNGAVYSQEKIIKEHPVYQGHSVDLEPRSPIVRGMKSSDKNYFVEMGNERHQQQERTNVGEVSEPHYEGSKNSGMYVRKGLGRLNEQQESSRQFEQIEKENRSTAKPNSIMWKNMSQWEAPSAMYEPRRPVSVDYRLEKRKERQQEYKLRREKQKSRVDQLTQAYIAEKQTRAKQIVLAVMPCKGCSK